MRRLRLVLTVLILLSASLVKAQSTQPIKLKGKVSDSTGAVMAATDVKAFQGTRIIKEAQTNDNGEFELDLPAGEYRVEVSAPDFNAFRQTVRVAPNVAPMAVTLSLAIVETTVEVKEE